MEEVWIEPRQIQLSKMRYVRLGLNVLIRFSCTPADDLSASSVALSLFALGTFVHLGRFVDVVSVGAGAGGGGGEGGENVGTRRLPVGFAFCDLILVRLLECFENTWPA